jgi:hypothetical protein
MSGAGLTAFHDLVCQTAWTYAMSLTHRAYPLEVLLLGRAGEVLGRYSQTGGRLVANTVTVESELMLLQWHSQYGGELTRIAMQRAEPIGKFLGWKAMVPVTQWAVTKS